MFSEKYKKRTWMARFKRGEIIKSWTGKKEVKQRLRAASGES